MKIGLALGGGGARGACHLGALYEFRRIGLAPDLITGASIGGLLGAMFAAGIELERIEELFRGFTISSLFSLPSASQPALIGSQKAQKMLHEFLGDLCFGDLRIPLAVTAVDLITKREVVLDHGDLVSAIMATTAVPVLAPPVERDNMVLVDGGLLNNLPFDVARARGATRVIAIDLSRAAQYGTPEQRPEPPWPDILGRAIAVTQRRPLWQVISTVSDIIAANGIRIRQAISPPDIMIRPDVGTMGLFDFHRVDEGMEIGREAVEAVRPQLEELLRLQSEN